MNSRDMRPSFQFTLWTTVCAVAGVAATFAAIRVTHTFPYWNVVPAVLLLASMLRGVNRSSAWGMIAVAMLFASIDHCWRLPRCYQILGYLHRTELQTRIGELYLTSFAVPFSLAVPAIIHDYSNRNSSWNAVAKWNMIAFAIATVDTGILTLTLYVTAAYFPETIP